MESNYKLVTSLKYCISELLAHVRATAAMVGFHQCFSTIIKINYLPFIFHSSNLSPLMCKTLQRSLRRKQPLIKTFSQFSSSFYSLCSAFMWNNYCKIKWILPFLAAGHELQEYREQFVKFYLVTGGLEHTHF